MNTRLLIPHSYRKPGWFVLLIGIATGIYNIITGDDQLQIPMLSLGNDSFLSVFDQHLWGPFYLVTNSVLNEIASVLIIAGGFMVGFSKEKVEDELTAQLRRESLTLAIYLNYAILLFAVLFTFDSHFYWVMVFNMFTVLLFHIVRFQYLLFRLKKSSHEE